MTIESQIQDLATKFAISVVAAIGESVAGIFGDAVAQPNLRKAVDRAGAELWSAPVKRKTGRLARRTPEQIAEAVAKVATLLKQKGPMRAEAIRADLGLQPKEMPRIMKDGIASKAFAILSGEKRSTTYGIKVAAKRAVKKK